MENKADNGRYIVNTRRTLIMKIEAVENSKCFVTEIAISLPLVWRKNIFGEPKIQLTNYRWIILWRLCCRTFNRDSLYIHAHYER